jgi:hypothetical protein
MRCLLIPGAQDEGKAETGQVPEPLVSESAMTQLMVIDYFSSQLNAAQGYYPGVRVSITGTDFLLHYDVLIGPGPRHGSYPMYSNFPSLWAS